MQVCMKGIIRSILAKLKDGGKMCNAVGLICGFYGDPMLQLLYVPTVLSQSAEVNHFS